MSALASSLALILAAYLLGSLSGGLLLGHLRVVDIGTRGSGNADGTNALRTQGWKLVLVPSGYVGLASLFASVSALLALFAHRGNLQRLRAGSESRFERICLLRERT
jgi:glycerol-3-phosphate acyltransferase PlsY